MTTRAFVIGHPIAHSRSPLIHGTWLAEHGIDGSYEAIDVAPDALEGFVARVRRGEFAGGNVTIPHKEAVFALCDEVDPLARQIGAVNTLVMRDGRLLGTNTDYLGFLGNLDAGAPGWSQGLERALVLGAGGAARAILVALASRGIPVILLNRTRASADRLAAEIDGDITVGQLDDINAAAPLAGLVVNTTSIGMHGSRFETFDLDMLRPDTLVTDIVYVPLETPLLADARARGLKTVDGLGMLLHQAVPGFEAWFGVRPQVTPALRAAVEATLGH
ncbi:shikimate dehydrogenase [Devosia geojensis]|uniref:Shikimate dehydrogenase (NADP(+)) n=1 Tax=Devosia geojensis TaxID=443610 RepID=A0A0F5FHX2_9HYPH|nr:shikimate dehydrogenase [Devosia geojensis]KKB08451.1 shikimate dehydrogenase [Devosia geojensis]